MADIVKYAESNPDPQYVGCRNTGALEDGVVFPGFEPFLGHVGFVGRTSIIEAVAALYGLTPADVTAALEDGTPKQKKQLEAKDSALAALRKEHDDLVARIKALVEYREETREGVVR